MILRYWGSVALRYVQSNVSNSNYHDNEDLSICSWFTTGIYNHNNENYSIAQSHIVNDTLLWISASLDPVSQLELSVTIIDQAVYYV